MKALLGPSNSWVLVSLAIGLLYVILPVFVFFWVGNDPYMLTLSGVSVVGLAFIVLGYHWPIMDFVFSSRTPRLRLRSRTVHIAVWVGFAAYLAVTLATADSIPIISALGNATADQLSTERANFLKLREGWQAALPYFSTVFVGALLPYSTTRLFAEKSSWRFFALTVFVIYTLLSLEKILFAVAVIPIAVLIVITHGNSRRSLISLAVLAIFSAAVLYMNTVLASGTDYFPAPVGVEAANGGQEALPSAVNSRGFFDISYRPGNALNLIVWRAVAVPVTTAADGLRVFSDQFGGQHLFGATSSLIARAAGLERVNFDAAVFAYEFGSGAVGRANSVFFVEAFVNFGWLGVVVFSTFVGQALRVFAKSDDIAFQSMWPIFCWFVFSGGLIGTLLSNGFAMLFILMLTFRVVHKPGGSAVLESALISPPILERDEHS